jgi:hypothetical protein
MLPKPSESWRNMEVEGRQNEYRLLCDDVSEFASLKPGTERFRIIGISGLGGVGKSYLFESVLRESKNDLTDALIIRIDGSNAQFLRDFAAMVDYQLAPQSLPPPADPRRDYFHLTRRLVHGLYSLRRSVESELDREPKIDEHIKNVAKAVYRARPLLAKIPKVGPWISSLLQTLEDTQAHQHLPQAFNALSNLHALKARRRFFGLRRVHEIVAHDPYNSIADAYRGDLQSALVRYRSKDRSAALPGRLRGVNRFLLIVDDFETTGEAFGEFLVESLLRSLQHSPLPVLAVFIGRDDLAEEHTGFHQHFSKAIIRKVRLQPFASAEAIRYLQNAGYTSEAAQVIYQKSGGYPFLLSLFAEHQSDEEQQTILFYQRFFERTTHWMTQEEKDWLLGLIYLDTVNTGTIAVMLPGTDAKVVLEWFGKEASVRDASARHYVVHPFIREMLLTYHQKLIGSNERRAYEERAREAMANA